MGALTAKNYTFKGRPWEARSIKSIATNNFFFEDILIDVRGKEVLRVLPYIGETYWLNNRIRFVKRDKLIRSSVFRNYFEFFVYSLVGETLTITKLLLEIFLEKSLRASLKFILQEVKESKEVVFIIGPTVDSKVISGIRDLSCLYGVGIHCISFFSEYRSLELDSTSLVSFDKKSLSVRLKAALKGKEAEDDEELKGDVVVNNKRALKWKLEGGYVCGKEVVFIVPSYLHKFMSKALNKFLYGLSNFFLNVGVGCAYNLSKIKANKVFNLNSYSDFSKKNYNFSCSYSESKNNEVFIPVSSTWSESRIYINCRGQFKSSYVVDTNGVPTISILFFIFSIVDKKIIKDEMIKLLRDNLELLHKNIDLHDRLNESLKLNISLLEHFGEVEALYNLAAQMNDISLKRAALVELYENENKYIEEAEGEAGSIEVEEDEGAEEGEAGSIEVEEDEGAEESEAGSIEVEEDEGAEEGEAGSIEVEEDEGAEEGEAWKY